MIDAEARKVRKVRKRIEDHGEAALWRWAEWLQSSERPRQGRSGLAKAVASMQGATCPKCTITTRKGCTLCGGAGVVDMTRQDNVYRTNPDTRQRELYYTRINPAFISSTSTGEGPRIPESLQAVDRAVDNLDPVTRCVVIVRFIRAPRRVPVGERCRMVEGMISSLNIEAGPIRTREFYDHLSRARYEVGIVAPK